MHEIDMKEAIRLCQELPLIQERLHRVGLHKTAQLMKPAMGEVGFEVAVHIEAEREKRNDGQTG